MIPDGVVDEVRARADIVEVVGEHVPLRKAGKDFKARCPFHNERTPSFYVVPAKGLYHCFGCGESGDVFTFLMKRQGLSFPDAVREVGRRVGVEVPTDDEGRGEDPYARLRQALAFAAEYYRERLRDPEAGAGARRYLDGRALGEDARERFLLGYAPDAWRALREAAHAHGMADDLLLEAGLIKESERSEEPYDRLRDRIVFPITDVQGRVIGFGGRALGAAGPKTPKYLNSPETPLYHKGEVLYGLHWSRTAIRREGEALVVEGYMDYVALASSGIENVVAPLGTAMTSEQATLLSRYTQRAFLLYDSDEAGLRATFRSGDALLSAGIHPVVVTLPDGEDPDSVVRAGGAGALAPYLKAAVDVLDRKLELLEAGGWLRDLDGLRTAVDKLLPTLRATTDAALRDLYVARIAERTGVRRETIEAEIGARHASTQAGVRAVAAGPGAPGTGGGRDSEPPRVPAAERQLLLLLLRDPRLVPVAGEELSPADLVDAEAADALRALLEAGPEREPGALPPGLPEAVAERLAGLATGDPEEVAHGERIFRDAIARIQADRLDRRLNDLERKLRLARGTPEEEALYRERAALVAEHRALGRTAERQVSKRGRARGGAV